MWTVSDFGGFIDDPAFPELNAWNWVWKNWAKIQNVYELYSRLNLDHALWRSAAYTMESWMDPTNVAFKTNYMPTAETSQYMQSTTHEVEQVSY